MLNVGRQLRLLREYLDMGLKELAGHLDITVATLSHAETKCQDTMASSVATYAHVLCISVEYFYSDMTPSEFIEMEKDKPYAYMLSVIPDREHWKRTISREYDEYQIEKNKAGDKFRISASTIAGLHKKGQKQKKIVPINIAKYSRAEEKSSKQA